MSLKPTEEIQVAALSAAVVYGVFQLNAPNLADVRAAPATASPATRANVHASVKTAAWTSAVLVSGLALLAKSPTIFVVGGLMTIAETWKFHYAAAVDPATGKPGRPGPAQ